MYTGVKSILERHIEEQAASAMRKLRPAYRKTMKTIHSCRTIEQLLCSYRMVENFNRMFPRAKRFTWNLYSEVCRRLGDEVKNVQEIT